MREKFIFSKEVKKIYPLATPAFFFPTLLKSLTAAHPPLMMQKTGVFFAILGQNALKVKVSEDTFFVDIYI
jgi:hypothetical protein